MTKTLLPLPIGVQTFEIIRQDNLIVVPIWRTRGRVRVSIGQAAERGRKMENRGQR